MKKFLLVILTFLCLSFSAQASQGIEVNVWGQGTEITISGIVSAKSKVSVFVSKNDRATEYKDVVFADETVCDDDGGFLMKFNMPDKFDKTYDATGSYTIHIASEGLGKTDKKLEYVSLKKQNELLAILNEKESGGDIKSLLLDTSNENTFESMGINISGYKKYAELQDDIAEIVFDAKPYAEISDFEKKYNDAFAVSLINNSTNADILAAELKNGRYVSLVVDETDISKDTNMFNFILNYLLKHKNYKETTEIEKTIKDGFVIYNLKNANKVSLTEIVKKYAEYMGVKNHSRFSDYENNITMQTVVNERTILSLSSAEFDSIGVFVEKFSAQLGAYTVPLPSGGSGGSSGSGSGVSYPGYAVSNPDKQSENQNSFSDMEGVDWAKEAIEFLHKKGIVNGMGDSKFNPNDNVTREQFTKMIVALADVAGNADVPFEDVQPDAWYYDYVRTGYSVGIISGISENMFGTGKVITREDAVVIIDRCMDLLKISAKDVREYVSFFDENEISAYARESVAKLYRKGIINGMDEGVFAPKATVTRAQAAKMIYEVCKVRGDV